MVRLKIMSVNAMAARNGIKADIESGMINGEPIPVWAIFRLRDGRKSKP